MLYRLAMIIAAFLLSFSLAMPEQAEAAGCQGLSMGKCKARSNCVWVKSYKRKGGVKVKAYCRSKASKSGTKKISKKSRKKKVEKKRRVIKKKKRASSKKSKKKKKKK